MAAPQFAGRMSAPGQAPGRRRRRAAPWTTRVRRLARRSSRVSSCVAGDGSVVSRAYATISSSHRGALRREPPASAGSASLGVGRRTAPASGRRSRRGRSRSSAGGGAPRPTAGRPLARRRRPTRDDRQVVEDERDARDVAGLVEVLRARGGRSRRASSKCRWPTSDSASMCSDHASIVRSPAARWRSSDRRYQVSAVARVGGEVVEAAEAPHDVALAARVAQLAIDAPAPPRASPCARAAASSGRPRAAHDLDHVGVGPVVERVGDLALVADLAPEVAAPRRTSASAVVLVRLPVGDAAERLGEPRAGRPARAPSRGAAIASNRARASLR